MNYETLKSISNALVAGYAAEYHGRRREVVLKEIENAILAVDSVILDALKSQLESA
jgi:hypothetical protein